MSQIKVKVTLCRLLLVNIYFLSSCHVCRDNHLRSCNHRSSNSYESKSQFQFAIKNRLHGKNSHSCNWDDAGMDGWGSDTLQCCYCCTMNCVVQFVTPSHEITIFLLLLLLSTLGQIPPRMMMMQCPRQDEMMMINKMHYCFPLYTYILVHTQSSLPEDPKEQLFFPETEAAESNVVDDDGRLTLHSL